ncbi:hypothetical protein [Motiliproteus sp. MSK22-1]|uniref:hypothetical protein n=1 Tax=Motiliproteus sp. MSK22-1 TaxID=1897630 RepID=UPI000975443B|nr:hypothetical protein [Motiliproteus sp. MSK22-1]OMH39329.1 hypothetical protein BGP75_03150 [Motiliproteus sp. MSK22-1]
MATQEDIDRYFLILFALAVDPAIEKSEWQQENRQNPLIRKVSGKLIKRGQPTTPSNREKE